MGPDQFAEITYDQDPGTDGWPGVMTRVQGAYNGSGYLAIAYAEQVQLYRADDTGSLNFTLLASADASLSTAPRQLRLESQGSTHRVYFNSVLMITYTDTGNTYSAGQPGIADTIVGDPVSILSFTGGDLGGTAMGLVRAARQPYHWAYVRTICAQVHARGSCGMVRSRPGRFAAFPCQLQHCTARCAASRASGPGSGSKRDCAPALGPGAVLGKDTKIGYSTMNARAEEAANKPAFREAPRKRRCLIPADAFYEWAKRDAKTKQPFAFGLRSGEPFAFAGLWERWRPKEGEAPGTYLETFTILTTDANEVLEPVHNRMPVILEPGDYNRWLEPAAVERLPVDLLRPFPAEQMISWPVGERVGNVRNNDPELLAARE